LARIGKSPQEKPFAHTFILCYPFNHPTILPHTTILRVGMKKIAVLPLLLITFINSLPLFAASRSITVVSQFEGETIKERFSTGTNHAVIIGINTYRHHPNLKTALNDAEAVAGLLENKYFFNHENIYLIKDTDATSERIMEVFRDLVATKVNKGDNLVRIGDRILCHLSLKDVHGLCMTMNW